MDKNKIKQAEEDFIDALSQPQSYETDGEKITQFDLEKRLRALERVKKAKIRNPFACISISRISTQGTER